MKKRILFLVLLLSFPTSFAATPLFDIHFSDGRNCKKCTFEEKQGYIISVKDSKSDEWVDISKPMDFEVYKSSFLSWSYRHFTTPAGSPPVPVEASSDSSFGKVLLQSVAVGAGAYAATHQTPPKPVYVAPTHTTCQSYFGTVNCNSY